MPAGVLVSAMLLLVDRHTSCAYFHETRSVRHETTYLCTSPGAMSAVVGIAIEDRTHATMVESIHFSCFLCAPRRPFAIEIFILFMSIFILFEFQQRLRHYQQM